MIIAFWPAMCPRLLATGDFCGLAANPGKEWNKYLVEGVCALHATKVSGAAQDREF
jgi:hypothetical protein